MRIGIDIDDTITATSVVLEDYARRYGDGFGEKGAVLQNVHKIARGYFDVPGTKEFFDTYAGVAWREIKAKPDAASVINDLRQRGDVVVLITTRGDKVFEGAERMTREFLDENGIGYDEIVFGVREKMQTCVEQRLDVMIDDSESLCEKLLQTEVRPILFSSMNNVHVDAGVPRADNWLDLEGLVEGLRG